jgi:hypothetical protein
VRLLGGPPPGGGADPVLDDQARAAYRARLAELDAELDQAVATGTSCSYTPPEPVHWRL